SRIVVGLKSPGRASSPRWATSCHVRAKILSFSSSRTAGSRYISEGSVDARATSVSSFGMPEHCRGIQSRGPCSKAGLILQIRADHRAQLVELFQRRVPAVRRAVPDEPFPAGLRPALERLPARP